MKKALVIGIDGYPSSPLTGCVNDANSINIIIKSNGDDSPNFETRLMTYPNLETSLGTSILNKIKKKCHYKEITRSVLREAIEKLFSGDSDMALFYFSGHGYITNTGGYLVTTDVKKYDEGVSMDAVLALANKSKAKNKLIILDCCYSGAMGTPSITENSTAQLSEGISILAASRNSEVALLRQDKKGSVFTSLLADALKGGAADIRGNITPGSLYAYVDEVLGAWDQRPIFKANLTGFSPVRVIPPKVPLEFLRKIPLYFPTPTDKHKLDPSYEYTEPNADSNKIKIFKELQALQSVGLVTPVDADYMYYAAKNSAACQLTALGCQYWRLANKGRL